MAETVGVAVITHRAKHHLPKCLPPLLGSPLQPRVVVVNSSSHDGTVEEAERLGAETLVIPRVEFNHGATRERARKHLGTDVVAMVTPDAYAVDEHVLGRMLEPILEGRAAVAYARQIPHVGAGFLEAFPRRFNYPETSELRSLADKERYGSYTIFCSNTFAGYRNALLDEAGGFPAVLSHEDQLATAALLQRGHKVAYVAEAVVHHSHTYTLRQEFQRYFDAGYARASYQDLYHIAGHDSSHGKVFLKALFKTVVRERPWLLPYTVVNTGVKWLGYKVGAASRTAPDWLKRACSGQDYYWTSTFYPESRST